VAELLPIYRQLRRAVDRLSFAPPVAAVYNPLAYAWDPFALYCERFGAGPKEVLLVGMNPGPFGMAQTGIPFGSVPAVRDWMGLEAPVGQPAEIHPQRPIDGFNCRRVEVSGKRLWGWAADRWGTPEAFFSRFWVVNYCPLAFMLQSGKNLTPNALPAAERQLLQQICDRALRRVVQQLQPKWVLGIGAFAEARLQQSVDDLPVQIGKILHPSPQSPLANRGWAAHVEIQLKALGIALPGPK
jgi:single-strand selective monofunctional uracil DNA glycosylase